MSERQQQEEIERILREIYKKYHKFHDNSFYYKLKGRKLKRTDIRSPSILINPYLEYLLYISTAASINPSFYCINKMKIYDALDQFFLSASDLDEFKIPLDIDYKDPLSQVFAYNYILSGDGQRHIYFCPSVLLVEPNDPDPTSIFHGKKGIIAFCISFVDLISSSIYTLTDDVIERFGDIYYRAVDTLEELLEEDQVEEVCNIDTIIDNIYDEIEEANRLMREYGIIRVAFPLE